MRFIFVIVLMLIAVALAAQNADVAAISVFWWEIRASQAVIVGVCFTLGALVASVLLAPRLYRQRATERRLQARIVTLEARATVLPGESFANSTAHSPQPT